MTASRRTRGTSNPPGRRRAGARDRDRATRTRSTRRRTPRLTRRQQLSAALVVAALVVVAAVVWFTPLLSVRQVQVRGVSAVTQEQVLTALEVAPGTPLLRVDLTSAAARVASLPRVARATVDRHYPSELVVTVTERVPVVFVDKPDGPHLLDGTGVDFATAPPPPGVPRLVPPEPARPLTVAALAVVGALPEAVRTQVEQVSPASAADVRLTLAGGRTVLWGAPEDLAHKGAVLAALLSQPGKTYDVSSPDLPTIS